MELNIGKFKVETLDDNNLVIKKLKQVKKKDTGEIKDEWVLNGYYGSLSKALKALLVLDIQESDANDVKSILKAIDDTYSKIIYGGIVIKEK